MPHGTTFDEENLFAFSYTMTYNLTGWPGPALSSAPETSAEGLPIGVQVVAQPWREDVALALRAARLSRRSAAMCARWSKYEMRNQVALRARKTYKSYARRRDECRRVFQRTMSAISISNHSMKKSQQRTRVRAGVDTGGTFTDFVYHAEGRARVFKLASTPADPSRAIIAGLESSRARRARAP